MAKSLFKAVVLVAVFSIITRFLGFVFKIYLSRELGAELLGVYQIAMSVFMVLVILVSSGLPLAVSKQTAKYVAFNNKKAENAVATSALVIGVIVSLAICLVFFSLQNVLGKMFTDFRCMEILLIMLPAVVASAFYSAFRGALWGRQDYFSVGWTELAEQVIRILLFVVMVEFLFTSLDGAVAAGLSMMIACVCSAILAGIVFFKKGGRLTKSKGYYKEVLKSSAPVTGVRAASSLIQPLIAVLFPFMLVATGTSNEVALSLFGIAMGMTFPLLFLPSTLVGSLSFTLIPELSTALACNKKNLAEERVRSGLLFAVIVSAMVIPLYMGVGVPICELLFDSTLSGQFLVGAAWIMIPLGLSNITSSILNAFNLEVKSFINNILGGLALILCVVCLTASLNVYALIIGFGLCMALTTFLNILMIKKHTKIKLGLIKPLLLCSLFAGLCAMLTHFVYDLCLYVFPSIIALILASGVAISSFVLLCICFKVCDFAFLISKFKRNKISTKKA